MATLFMVYDEEGKLKAEPVYNALATFHYQLVHGAVDVICGNVLICNSEEK